MAEAPASSAFPQPLATAFEHQGSLVHVRANRMLISPDMRSTRVYRVLVGRVQVALISSAGRQVILRDLVGGDLFGELAAIDGEPRSTSIFALEDCTLASLPGAVFRQMAFSEPESVEWLARRLTALIRDLTDKVYELNALRVAPRLHCEILRLCGAAARTQHPPVIEPAPTHAEFAARIGCHREAVTREMGYLAERGIINTERRRLTVVDLPRLVNLVRAAAGHPGIEAHAATADGAPRA